MKRVFQSLASIFIFLVFTTILIYAHPKNSFAACQWIYTSCNNDTAGWSCMGLTCNAICMTTDCTGTVTIDNPPTCTSITPIGKIGCSNFSTGIDLGSPNINTINHPQCGTKDDTQFLPSCPLEGCRVGCYLGGSQGNDPFVSGNEAFSVAYPSSTSVRLTVNGYGQDRQDNLPGCPGGCPVDCTRLYNYSLGGGGCDDPQPNGYGCRKCNPNVGNFVSHWCSGGSCTLPPSQLGNYSPPQKLLVYNIPTFTTGVKPSYLMFDVVNNNLGSFGSGYLCTPSNCAVIKPGTNTNNLYVTISPTDTIFYVAIQYVETPPVGTGFTVTNVRPAWVPDASVACAMSNQPLPVAVKASDDKGWSTKTTGPYTPIDFTYSSTVYNDKTNTAWVPGNPPINQNVITYAPNPTNNTTLYGQVSDSGNSYPNGTASCPAAPIACLQNPAKYCTVSVTGGSSTTSPGLPVTITYSGYSQNQDTVRLFIERKDKTAVYPSLYGGTYYQLDGCDSNNKTTCTKTVTINNSALALATGDYYIHCDVPTDDAVNPPYEKCSGNPFCDYKGIPNVSTNDCSVRNWTSCSQTDYVPIKINPPTPVDLTGQAFDDQNSNGCWDSGEPAISGGLFSVDSIFSRTDALGIKNILGFSGNYAVKINGGYDTLLDASGAIPGNFRRVTGYPNLNATLNCSTNVNLDSSSNVNSNSPKFTGIKNIGFTNNIPWLSTSGAGIYAGGSPGGYTIAVPPTKHLINNSFDSLIDAGSGVSNGSISTKQGNVGSNLTSVKGTQPTGWEVQTYILNQLSTLANKVNFNLPNSILTTNNSWLSLTANTIYGQANNIPGTVYSVPGSGVAYLYVNNNLSVNGNILKSLPNQGLVIIVNGDVTIDPGVTQIDGIIIAKGKIESKVNSPSLLIVNGGLYSGAGGIDLSGRDIGNNFNPAVTVNYDPIYLFGFNNVIFKTNTLNWKEAPPN